MDLVVLVAMLELAGHLSELISGLDALAIGQVHATRAPHVERIERTSQAENLLAAVVGIDVGRRQAREALEEMRVEIGQRQRLAVHVAFPFEVDLLPGAEQVVLLDLGGKRVLAARAAETDAGIQCPDVAGAHFEVHNLPVVGDRYDHGLVEIVVRSQDPFGLQHEPAPVRFARLEEQLVLDDFRPRFDVQLVGRPVQPAILAVDARVEHVADDHGDLADDGPARLEFLRRREDAGTLSVTLAGDHACAAEQRHQQRAVRDAASLPIRTAQGPRSRYGIRTVEPTVRRASRSRCACATSCSA